MAAKELLASVLLMLGTTYSLRARAPKPGKNLVDVRGHPQEISTIPPRDKTEPGRGESFCSPGDGGWRGFAVDLAKAISDQGYDVFGWDIKKYLTGFTGKTNLTEQEIMADTRRVADWVIQGKNERIGLAGWSQGAAMAVLATASPKQEQVFQGVVAVGLPESAVLGWKLADDLTYLTKKEPNEPKFSTAPYLPRVAPVPLVLIYSTQDAYISTEDSRKLFSAAREPKRFFLVEARDHRYDGNRDDFFRSLREGLEWICRQQ